MTTDLPVLNGLLGRAISIAADAHKNQTDKLGKPYILHPIQVMLKMQTEEEMIVAVLHDVLEDTDLDVEVLKLCFSPAIVEAVLAITKRKEERNIDYLARVKENPLALRVKLRDIEHNSAPERLHGLSYGEQEYLSSKLRDALDFLEDRI